MSATPFDIDQQLAQMREELAGLQDPRIHLGNAFEGRKEGRIATLQHRINQLETLKRHQARGPITIA